MPTVQQDRLANRIRSALIAESPVREVTMFGGRVFMVNEKIIVGVDKTATCLSASRLMSTTG